MSCCKSSPARASKMLILAIPLLTGTRRYHSSTELHLPSLWGSGGPLVKRVRSILLCDHTISVSVERLRQSWLHWIGSGRGPDRGASGDLGKNSSLLPVSIVSEYSSLKAGALKGASVRMISRRFELPHSPPCCTSALGWVRCEKLSGRGIPADNHLSR